MPARGGRDEIFTLTELGQETLEIPSLEILCISRQNDEQRVPIGLTALVVGKDPDADVRLDDPRVSRRHCSLTLTERGVVLRDLGSKNGTFVGGVQVVEAILTPSVEVTVGGARLWVQRAGSPETVALSLSPRFGDALGTTVVMRALFARLERAAASMETVLLLGESGTGKELLARGVHERSPNREGPFVVFDCGAVAPDLIESELFGFVRGAFTGAISDRASVFEQADGGTLFLDEIGELPLSLQPKLLRAIEARQFRRVGSNAWKGFKTRVVVATHRDLRALVTAGTFREDLYFRIAVLRVDVPPLRDRPDDIPLLVEKFLASQDPPRALGDLPEHALAMLRSHSWPGNVRELRNTVARILLFPHLGREAFDSVVPTAKGELPLHLPLREAREQIVEAFEQKYVTEKLREHKGNVSRAAESMGVSRQLVHRLMERYGIRSGGK
jgi:transcriptional regulator with PAS, ATPase and Fis domain